MKILKALRKPFETPQRSVKIKILVNFSPRPESGQEGLIMIKKWFLGVHWFLTGSTQKKQIPRSFKVSNGYWRFDTYTAWIVSKCRDFSGPYFPVFGLNTEIYFVNIRIQSECRKIQIRRNSAFGPSKKERFICVNESPLKMMKNDFHFILKALFVLKIF